MPEDPPEYRVYRSRPRLIDRLRGIDSVARLRARGRGEEPERRGPRRPITGRRVLRWLVLAVLAWLALSAVVFLVSAQIQEGQGLSPGAEEALAGGSSLLTGSTILVLGSDARPEGSKEPGAGGAARADSIMLLRASLGQVRRVSILRDSYAEIPGHGAQKINAAFALGGTRLMARTVERFMGNGLEVNHVIQVNFDDFPKFIDSMGGINVTLENCVRSDPFSGRRLSLSRGKRHLNGRQALAFARVRKNKCAPNEDDRARAARQQQVLSAIRSRLFSPVAFIRLPLVSWAAPRALDTDLAGPGLLALFADVVTGGSGETRVMEPAGTGPGGSLQIGEQERARSVRHLNGRDE